MKVYRNLFKTFFILGALHQSIAIADNEIMAIVNGVGKPHNSTLSWRLYLEIINKIIILWVFFIKRVLVARVCMTIAKFRMLALAMRVGWY